MRHIPKPTLEIDNIIKVSTSNMRNNGDQKYINAIPVIEEYSKIHDDKMKNHLGYQLSTHEEVTSDVGTKEMIKLYSDKFSKEGQPGRKFYDKILIAAPRGVCPYCGIGIAVTLDHYFPKALYPKLAVTPQNLLPSCRDCNTEKKEKVFSNLEDMPIHPYYEEVQSFDWLTAKIISTSPLCVKYAVDDAVTDPILKQRLDTHMKIFKLYECYAIKASEEVIAIKYQLEKVFLAGGEDELKKYIFEIYESSYNNEKNSWRTALYRALLDTSKYVTDTKLLL